MYYKVRLYHTSRHDEKTKFWKYDPRNAKGSGNDAS